MKHIAWLWAFILVASGLVNMSLAGAAAQGGNQSGESVEEIKARTGEINARAGEINARAAYEKAAADRIGALGIPQFKGETKANVNVGELEASMLSAAAIGDVAGRIATTVKDARWPPATAASTRPIIVLSGTEPFDASVVGHARWQMTSLCDQFQRLVGRSCRHPEGESPSIQIPDQAFMTAQVADGASPLATAIPIANAIFGALRSDVEITAVATKGITDALLARAVTQQLPGRAVLPSALVISPERGREDDIPALWNALSILRAYAEVLKNGATGDANKEMRERLATVIGRYDTFATSMTTPDAQGTPPIARAARLERLLTGPAGNETPLILRLFVDQAGGSLVNTTNIGTFIGLDPLRVSGGAITSFTLTDPQTGAAWAADAYSCQTALVRLRRVQDRRWRSRMSDPLCQSVLATPSRTTENGSSR